MSSGQSRVQFYGEKVSRKVKDIQEHYEEEENLTVSLSEIGCKAIEELHEELIR